ncbi:MAG: hypothetical protein IPK76_22420 [Lewinellaceae bacterium]|nr:hypothetical protein [Lewinellaceae bacterium]
MLANWKQKWYCATFAERQPRIIDPRLPRYRNLGLDELDLRRIAVRLGNPSQRPRQPRSPAQICLRLRISPASLHLSGVSGGFQLWLNDLAAGEGDEQGSGEKATMLLASLPTTVAMELPGGDLPQPQPEPKRTNSGASIWWPKPMRPTSTTSSAVRWLALRIKAYADQLRGTRLEETLR